MATEYKNLQELIDIENLKSYINSKITIIKQSDFGFPQAIQIKLTNAFFKDYAQYSGQFQCLQIEGKPKNCSNIRAYLIRPYQDVFIYEGFVDVNDYTSKTSTSKATITYLGTCFDNNSLIKAANIEANLIASTIGK